MPITKEQMICRWSDPDSRPLFRGKLIDDSGDTPCLCAQGDVLHQCGVSLDDLRSMDQDKADAMVAKELGITIFESILLRKVNDSQDGCPQAVLSDLTKILGPRSNLVVSFWRHAESMTPDQIARAARAARDARDAWDAWDARDAWAAWAARAAWDAFCYAQYELLAWTNLKEEPYFLKFFFEYPDVWVASIDPTIKRSSEGKDVP